jgi:hypothetical protein
MVISLWVNDWINGNASQFGGSIIRGPSLHQGQQGFLQGCFYLQKELVQPQSIAESEFLLNELSQPSPW